MGAYRLLIDCIPCPTDDAHPALFMTRHDHRIWTWLTKAGLRLTTSELIRLEEQQTLPEPELLGEAGRQELTNLIYSADTICDRLLDTLMESSSARDSTVATLLHLLQKHCLILV